MMSSPLSPFRGLSCWAVAGRLNQHVFSAGNTVDPAVAYRAFRGRDARTEPLMEKRGFPTTGRAADD